MKVMEDPVMLSEIDKEDEIKNVWMSGRRYPVGLSSGGKKSFRRLPKRCEILF